MGEKRKAPKHGFKPGQSGNPSGRPRGTGRPVSRLRSTLRSLTDMEEKALEIIRSSVSGKADIDKESLATAKWVIGTIVTVNRAAVADEQLSFNIRQTNLERELEEQRRIEEEAAKPNSNIRRFTTDLINMDQEG